MRIPGLYICAAFGFALSVAATPVSGASDSRRAHEIDRLFEQLAQAPNPEITKALQLRIQHIWLEGDGPTLDMLMARALASVENGKLDVALNLLNHVVRLAPDWQEGWNKRATVRFMMGDLTGSLADIDRTLSLEPRNFGALWGEAAIFEQFGRKAEALKAYRQIFALTPKAADLATKIERLSVEVEGQGI